ncbi:ABZ2 [Candida pseudojiufengensis]|uniref:ABZ2 n=1 Tax=Candida pseudojiufengensis TaxID=497109 RepID=UPI002224C609|nr:ABZ2 [Candida pseudojiufengensis]KAI5964698.1 ABZ2 [Candida pseudojiufengensis]
MTLDSASTNDDIISLHNDYFDKNFPTKDFPQDDFEILSTIRYDPNLTESPPIEYEDITNLNFFLLKEHVDRLNFTLQFFNHLLGKKMTFEITEDFFLSQLVLSLKKSEKLMFIPYKIRVLVKLDGSVKIEIYETPNTTNLLFGLFPQVSEFDLYFDQLDSENDWDIYKNKELSLISPFTSFKTTKRDVYNQARLILPGNKPGKEEVLLFNSQSQLMEGSITNVAIKRSYDGKWVTPLLSSGCLCGVTRHFLLRKNYIEEDTITLDQINLGTELLLFNGIIGVVKGKVVG